MRGRAASSDLFTSPGSSRHKNLARIAATPAERRSSGQHPPSTGPTWLVGPLPTSFSRRHHRPSSRPSLHVNLNLNLHSIRCQSYVNNDDTTLTPALIDSWTALQTHTRPYSATLETFVSLSIDAFELGSSTFQIRRELPPSSSSSSSTPTTTTTTLPADPLLSAIVCVWLTLLISRSRYNIDIPRRLSTLSSDALPSVSDVMDAALSDQWTGFVTLITSGYFERRMGSYSLDKLQLEVSAMGAVLPQHETAEFARIVYTTLERISPQFPK